MKLALFVVSIVTLTACQGETLFPRCDDPAHPCPPVEPNYPATDRDGLGTPLGDACERLRRMGCPEGWPNRKERTCFESYTAASKLAAVPAACIKASVTHRELRACGDDNSVRVRCELPAVDAAGSSAP